MALTGGRPSQADKRGKELHGVQRAQKAVLESEQRLRLLVEGVVDYAIYMLDPSGTVTNWNTGAERLTGYRADEIVGQHFSRFYPPEDRAAGLPQRVLEAAARDGRFEAEGWRIRKDGSRFWASAVLNAIHDETGALIGFAKVTRDATERRAAQDALRESERQFRLLVKNVIDYAVFMLDPSGVIVSWNTGAERIKGYKADEIIGQHFSCFYTKQDRAAGIPVRALEVAIAEGRFEAEGWRVRKDGTLFWANVVIDPIRDDDGSLIGFAKITRDITERRNAQLRLQEMQAQRDQAQKMEALGHLTGGRRRHGRYAARAWLRGRREVRRTKRARRGGAPQVRPCGQRCRHAGRDGWHGAVAYVAPAPSDIAGGAGHRLQRGGAGCRA